MMKLHNTIGFALVLSGCAPAGGNTPATAPAPASVSVSFAVTPAAAAALAPSGEGVALRWADALSLTATTAGLGPVERSAVAADGAVTLSHPGGVDERWRSDADGAEQSWRYAEPPAGGRVAVGVTLAGASFERVDEGGVHLRASTGALLRYSHATWVGADGARTAVPARWVGGRIVIEVPPGVVARTRFPAVLDPTLTASFPLSDPQPTATTLVGYTAVLPEIVQVGASTLVFHALRVRGTGAGVTTVRQIDATGAYVPGSLRGVPGSAYFAYIDGLRAAWAASYGAGAMVIPPSGGVTAVRVAPDGRSLDPTALLVHAPTSAPGGPVVVGGVACTATVCLVAYTEGNGTYAQRVGTDGRLLDATPIVLGTTRAEFSRQAVTVVGDRFVVAWSTTLPGAPVDIRISRVSTAGAVLDPGGRPVTTAAVSRSDLAVATDGSRLFLKWYAYASGPRPTGTYTQLFDADMTSLSSLTAHTDLALGTTLWWDGAQYELADYQRLARFDAAGARLDATARPVLSSGSTRWIGPVLGGFFMQESEGVYRYSTLGVRVNGPTGFVLGFRQPSLGLPDFEGDHFLTAWGDGGRVSLGRYTAAGVALDVPRVDVTMFTATQGVSFAGFNGARAEFFADRRMSIDLPTRVATPSVMSDVRPSAVIRGGAQRLAVQAGCVRRLDAAWQTIDPAPVCFTPATSLSGDHDGTNFRFVYALPAMYTRRLNADGDAVEFAPVALTSLGTALGTPVIAFGGGTHLVAWQSSTDWSIRAATLSVDGTVGPSVTVAALVPLNTAPPQLVFDGVNFVVAWVLPNDHRVYAARVSPAGVRLDATPFTFNASDGPQVAAGERFAMVSDRRGSTLVVYNSTNLSLGCDQIRAAFLREDGVVLPDAGVVPLDVPRPVDAGSAVDAGTSVDTGVDAGAATDVGAATDAPVGAGAGVPPGDDGGCSVGGAPRRGAPGWVFALGVVLASAATRRRDRRASGRRGAESGARA